MFGWIPTLGGYGCPKGTWLLRLPALGDVARFGFFPRFFLVECLAGADASCCCCSRVGMEQGVAHRDLKVG
ncbi:hypothetical protein GQ457_05G025630 [Hibiscus cannabinus]